MSGLVLGLTVLFALDVRWKQTRSLCFSAAVREFNRMDRSRVGWNSSPATPSIVTVVIAGGAALVKDT
jgi:hypothetical protein